MGQDVARHSLRYAMTQRSDGHWIAVQPEISLQQLTGGSPNLGAPHCPSTTERVESCDVLPVCTLSEVYVID
jgi:hypothetical protein